MKKYFQTFVFVLWSFSSYSQDSSQIKTSVNHFVGEKYGGGIVFLVYDEGQHGLIASLQDLSKDMGYYPDGAGMDRDQFARAINRVETSMPYKSWSVIDGMKNTEDIIKMYNSLPSKNNYAALACRKYNFGGFTDWYLPALFELKSLCDNMLIINKILENDDDPLTSGLYDHPSAVYASSTSQPGYPPIGYHIYEGHSVKNISPVGYCVRAVRKF